MSFLMSDILTTIRDLAAMEIADLGDDETTQNDAIYRFVNVSLRKRARQAYNVVFSDALAISSNGFVTFQKSEVDISDLYEPLAVYDSNDKVVSKRTQYDSTNTGWFKESDNQEFHMRGLNGNYTLKYIRYPAAITASTDTVEFPLSGQMDLIMDVVQLIKLVKNYYQESDAIKARATGVATYKASLAARGTNSAPPSAADLEG